ncbi:EpsD family peptidyl-prolyl cis-trans isomerase [Deefgea piscis]|uniref:EpsD family peptidyl-prolyl cis-trans isomerase n=1 Tax=Deefgea piscis TaxID=2739061 RepID=UPI001C7E5BC7|nr:EpsD family peptidyl-prolyl cis-trans isomerase [Deefgea piscis]QZA82019.1 EpsD family peptidyl-prolyl cis-trans isomerase [Deefgea piscis]
MKKLSIVALALSTLFLLTACNDKDEKKSPSQVLAKVNDAEITVHQLNFVLGQMPQATAEQKQQVLDQLIDQELLVNKATELKLDREPNIVQAIEAAKRQILAQAAAERVIGKPAEPSKTAIDDFYAKNSGLFADRKNYEFVMFLLDKDKFNDEIIAQLDSAVTPMQVKAILDAAKIPFETNEGSRAAEQLPMQMLPKFVAMKQGDILSMNEGNKTMLLQLKNSQPAPVTPVEAEPLIKRYLSTNDAQENAKTKLKALRATAKIEYLQKFASAPVAAPATGALNASAVDESLKAGLKGLK